MGACTVTVTENTVFGNKRVVFGTIKGSSVYAQGGETFTFANIGLNVVDHISIRGGYTGSAPAASYVPVVDLANKKLLFFGGAAAGVALQEAAASADVSGASNFFIAYGA